MKPRYFAYTLITLTAVIAWNAFLIQRDDAMFKAYYRHQAIENLKKPPSAVIR